VTARRLGDSSVPVALYDVDPDTIAALVTSCPAVAAMSGGPFGAAATYLPGRTVPGVQITPDTVEVHVVARYAFPVAELATQVRRVLSGQVLGRSVDIVVEDLQDPPGALPRTPIPSAAQQVPAPATAFGRDVGWPPATLPPAAEPARSPRPPTAGRATSRQAGRSPDPSSGAALAGSSCAPTIPTGAATPPRSPTGSAGSTA